VRCVGVSWARSGGVMRCLLVTLGHRMALVEAVGPSGRPDATSVVPSSLRSRGWLVNWRVKIGKTPAYQGRCESHSP
jgi:hypothetical protein